ncbi:MAG TPA: adenylate/guanylate cyclase domain-containing protein [Methylomirabilota bacterium]|nr:adenylate/guanylate cyclase domain-containing protein [Methylomirabilota bacterium]
MAGETPAVQYARCGDVHVAYQVAGAGPLDLVFIQGWISHLELGWEHPLLRRFFERLSAFARLILIDKRGTGMSDPVPVHELPSLEQRIDDIRAVMDAVGSERAALLGVSEGGPMNILLAASQPARTHALILFNSFARIAWAPDYPIGVPSEDFAHVLARIENGWGRGALWSGLAPSLAGDPRERQAWARYQRMAASPAAAAALLRMSYETDARPLLGAVSVPTLVLHSRGDRFISADNGRYLAEHIPGARFVELPGPDHFFAGADADAAVDEIGEFLTGQRQSSEAQRVLATVVMTDIVGSTEQAAALGDRRWRDLLEGYLTMARRQLGRFGGRELDTAGDGLLAAFDGPARAVRCATAIRDGARTLGVRTRAGVHAGECEVLGGKLAGIAVHTGARVAAEAAADEVLVSGTVKDLVAGSGLAFVDRGVRTLKGVPGEWRIFAVA